MKTKAIATRSRCYLLIIQFEFYDDYCQLIQRKRNCINDSGVKVKVETNMFYKLFMRHFYDIVKLRVLEPSKTLGTSTDNISSL